MQIETYERLSEATQTSNPYSTYQQEQVLARCSLSVGDSIETLAAVQFNVGCSQTREPGHAHTY